MSISVVFNKAKQRYLVTGEGAKAIKDRLKEAKGWWLAAERAWSFTVGNGTQLQAVLQTVIDDFDITNVDEVDGVSVSTPPEFIKMTLIKSARTKTFKTQLMEIGGVWIPSLGGWLIPREHTKAVKKMLRTADE